MRNEFLTTLRLKRIDICDLMIACTCAKYSSNDGGEKWERLRNILKDQLHDLDAQIDALQDF